MAQIVLWTLVFIISLAFLIKASDMFTVSAEKIGLYLGIPPFIIGVTIVSIGTSLPELVSSIFAVVNNSSEVVIGNVIGSNITNIFLVLGITAIVGRKINIRFELINVDLPLFVGSTFLLILILQDSAITIIEALLLLSTLIIYLLYTVRQDEAHEGEDIVQDLEQELKKELKMDKKAILLMVTSAVIIYFSAEYTIKSIIHLSEIINVGKEIIAITVMALGTSLPELVVSIQAARRGKSEIAVGNVLGSNIFNTCAVTAIPSLIGPLVIPPMILSFGIPVLLVATFLYLFITQDKQITQWEGWLLVIFYIFFVGKIIAVI